MGSPRRKPAPGATVPVPVARPAQDLALGMKETISGSRAVIAYDPDRALEVCELIAQGYTLKKITEQKDDQGRPLFVSYSTFQRWVLNNPELRKAYLAARELSALAFEDEALRMAYELSHGQVTEAALVRAYDVAMNQLRWSASKRNPREYGERQSHNITVPIQINTSLDLGQGGVPKNVEENVYNVKAVVAQPVPELLDPNGRPVVETRPQGRPSGFRQRAREGLPTPGEMKERRAEKKRLAEIEEARRAEDAVEVR